ncbi:MAG: TrkH family potassium uptake protein [Sumerlaeia bacterium]
MNYRLISKYLGLLLGVFSLSIFVALPFAIYFKEWHALVAIIEAIAAGMIVSVGFWAYGRGTKGEPYRRETLAIVGLAWMMAAGIGALPMLFSGITDGSFTDAYFESMSGLTTTGSTILQTIEDKPKSILLWRSFLHFLGGLGIVVLFVAVLPLLGVGGRSLFKTEVPGPSAEGMTPRIKDTAISLWKLYIGLNALETVLLMWAGMGFYDAINHAMATMATGGFSTKNASILAFYSPMVEWIIILFMYIAGTNFALLLRALKGKFEYHKDPEFLTYSGIILFSSVFIAMALYLSGVPNVEGSPAAVSDPASINLRDAFFIVIALQTTTGFGTVDFQQWPEGVRILLLILMFFGGCSGSTGGGLKVIRWIILAKVAAHQIASEVSPRRVRALKLGDRVIGQETSRAVLILFFLWIGVVFFGSFAVAILSPDQTLLTSFTAVIATLNNIGPGLDAVGPTSNFDTFQPAVKWLLALFMALGRLELYAIAVLFAPSFWFQR